MHRGDGNQLRELTAHGSAAVGDSPTAADLTPFVPRIVPEWIADAPNAAHRSIDGTLLFADLSGFTAMSERLGSLGKVGAEELTDHLDTIFSELITVAGTAGGSMLKFGGDALLILFWGGGHEKRAAWAAVSMQEALDRVGKIETSAGPAVLQMTVGAHAGNFDLFLAGNIHRALFVCGRQAAETVSVEGKAKAGEIRVSPSLAKRLAPELLTDKNNEAPRLVAAPDIDGLGIREVRPWPKGTSAETFVPEMLRSHLSSAERLTEHRQMAVGFLHLTGVDDLIDRLGAETAAEQLDEVVSMIQERFSDHGVTFVSTDVYEEGPKIVCATGAVRTFGDDEERLLRALREIVDTPSPIAIRAGVNRGHGFCGYVGPSFRRTFAMIGDVVNTAARVMAKSSPGEILATPSVIDRSDTAFETTELPAFAAKGKSEKLVAHRVGRIIGHATERATRDVPFVGRAHVLGALRDALDEARAGRGRLIDITGVPGIGKTRLVRELLADATDVAIAQERCGRYASATPYFPLRTLLGSLIGERTEGEVKTIVANRRSDLAPYLGLLSVVRGGEAEENEAIKALPPAQRREKMHEVAAAAIASLIEAKTVWFLDDTHWLDSGSHALLAHLAGALDDLPLLICTTRRPDGEPIKGAHETLSLEDLAAEDAASVLRAASGRHLLPRELDLLFDRAGGNPMFLIELGDVAAHDRQLAQLPDSLEAALAARIDSLEPAQRRVLRHLAVVGSRFSPTLAAEAIEDLPALDHESWTELAEFVDTTGDPWLFTQPLVRETAYEGLSFRERRSVHARVGAVIEGQTQDPLVVSELLSLHFHSATEHPKSLIYSNHAGERANRAFAFAETATFFGRSVEAARGLGDEEALGEALTALGHAEIAQGDYARAGERYGESLEIKRRLGNMQGVAAQLNGLGNVARSLGDYPSAQQYYEDSWRTLTDLEEPENIDAVLRNIGTVAWLRGDYPGARSWFERALEAAKEAGNEASTIMALDTLGSVAMALGEISTARSNFEEAAEAKRRAKDKPGLALTLNNLGGVLLQAGDRDAARTTFSESLALRREIGDRAGVASSLSNIGTVEYFDERYDEAHVDYDEALGIFREIGDPRGASRCLHNLSEIAIVRSDLNAAEALCTEALEIRRSLQDPRGEAESLTTLGKINAGRGRPDAAREFYIAALEVLLRLENTIGIAECLEFAAAVLEDAVVAATVLSSVDGLLASSESARSWTNDGREPLELSLRDQLGDQAYEEATSVGQAMSADRAVALVVGTLQTEPEKALNA